MNQDTIVVTSEPVLLLALLGVATYLLGKLYGRVLGAIEEGAKAWRL